MANKEYQFELGPKYKVTFDDGSTKIIKFIGGQTNKCEILGDKHEIVEEEQLLKYCTEIEKLSEDE